MKRLISMLALGLMCSVGCDNNAMTDRDNTAVNERDANGAHVTPMDQSNDQADIDQVAAIRKEVLKIDGLSINGRNTKIVTGNGQIVLRGPVASEAERTAIAQATAKVAPGVKIVNELEVDAK
ncbi:MAG TPA: BON domain-containing protein [Pirellulaceae bacterium]|nr:BON domain-containing protein [Planctomycetales bacterium]HRX81675.1 BON domain-containing protein [Pirellulaceae bacterium]